VFVQFFNGDNSSIYIRKLKWVPNGEATLEQGWGENGEYLWTQYPAGSGSFSYGLAFNGDDTIFATYCNQYDMSNGVSEILFLDAFEGTKKMAADLSEWYVNIPSRDNGGQFNGGPSNLAYMNGILYTQGLQSCIALAIDPARDTGDMVVWVNGNGDYIHDINFEKDSQAPWMCNDFNHPPYMYGWSVDPLGFSAFPVCSIGALSFGLFGPDGKGIGYFGFASETGNAWYTNGPQLLNTNSAFDGLYNDHPLHENAEDGGLGIWYIAYDTVKGTITSQVGVAGAAPERFTVHQNIPNPFNPTTTISFTVPQSGRVTVDVFNVAGQKVGVIADTFMYEGARSVVWNASGFAAGVYFCRVRTGGASETIKMTLLR